MSCSWCGRWHTTLKAALKCDKRHKRESQKTILKKAVK